MRSFKPLTSRFKFHCESFCSIAATFYLVTRSHSSRSAVHLENGLELCVLLMSVAKTPNRLDSAAVPPHPCSAIAIFLNKMSPRTLFSNTSEKAFFWMISNPEPRDKVVTTTQPWFCCCTLCPWPFPKPHLSRRPRVGRISMVKAFFRMVSNPGPREVSKVIR